MGREGLWYYYPTDGLEWTVRGPFRAYLPDLAGLRRSAGVFHAAESVSTILSGKGWAND